MPVRLKITILFALLVSAILLIVCGAIYYFSYSTRLHSIKGRLVNRAITTARLLSQSSFFDRQLVRRIDSATALAMKQKSVQAYDYLNSRIYWYADSAEDTIAVNKNMLDDARIENDRYFNLGGKDVIAHHYTDDQNRMVIVAGCYDEAGKKNLQQLRLILWISFAGGILISVIGGYIFSGRLLSPVRNITTEVNDISAQNLTRRIAVSETNDEWQQLSVTLNDLLNRLQESFDTQRRFISNASHELSTPLTAISSQLEVALQRERDPEAYRQILGSVHQDIRHLSDLTRTLLEFAKASGNSGGLDIELVRMDEILLELPAYMKKIDPSYAVHLQFDALPAEEEQLLVAGNRDLLKTCIKNIVSNACKFSFDHLANVSLSVHAGALIIEVHNHGTFIPATEVENIFQPFYRAGETRAVAGFGLGLSLASRIIKIHRGEISVTSAEAAGTTFTVKLPIASRQL